MPARSAVISRFCLSFVLSVLVGDRAPAADCSGAAEAIQIEQQVQQALESGDYGRIAELSRQLESVGGNCPEEAGEGTSATSPGGALNPAPSPSSPSEAETEAEKKDAEQTAKAREAFDQAKKDFDAGNYEAAEEGFQKAYEEKKFPQFLFNVGASRERQGDYKGAAEAYRKYLEESPDASDREATEKRIAMLEKEDAKQTDRARESFDEAQEAFEAGRYDEAAEKFEKAYGEKDYPEFLFNVGAAKEKAGDPKGAADAFKKYLEEKPDASDREAMEKRIADLERRAE
jgi:tetratricopeptide (TPR) repeat protein